MIEYVWTYWTRQGDIFDIFDIACIALSTSLVKKHGKAKYIYTDTFGKKMIDKYLIDVECVESLNYLETYNSEKWAISKIDTYQKINYPCVHIDYDVFLWQQQKISNLDFCCQSIEEGDHYGKIYEATLNDFLHDTKNIPDKILKYSSQKIYAGYNMGYFQINNWEFLNKYAKESFLLFPGMKKFNRHNNIFPEQYLFYCMAKTENINVDLLLNNETSWDEQSLEIGYTHLMGEKRLNKKNLMQKITERLQKVNPTVHEAIINNIKL